MKIDDQKKFRDLLRQIPVAVNNFYGDPTIQWRDTLSKLDDLVATRHEGPVGVILKGRLTDHQCQELAFRQAQGLRLVILVSISELVDMEKVAMEHRYQNIAKLNKVGVPAIGCVRPLTPPYNTSKEVIDKIFKRLGEVNCKAAVVAGFRGDDHLIAEMQPEKVVEWVLRVKQMTPEIWQRTIGAANQYGVQLFTRTSCAVSYLLGDRETYNPYNTSPHLVKCEEVGCPIRDTCQNHKKQKPREGSLEFLKFLGYDVEFEPGDGQRHFCGVKPDDRLKCLSCCTTCFILNGNPRIIVNGKVSLGDLTFIRFISGVIAVQPGLRDTGDLDIGKVTFPNFPQIEGIQCLNSWWPIARVGDKCFDCKYCIEKYYVPTRKEFGFSPARLLERLDQI